MKISGEYSQILLSSDFANKNKKCLIVKRNVVIEKNLKTRK